MKNMHSCCLWCWALQFIGEGESLFTTRCHMNFELPESFAEAEKIGGMDDVDKIYCIIRLFAPNESG